MIELGEQIVHTGWRPDVLSVRLPLLSFRAPQNPEDGEQITEEVDKGCSEFCVAEGTVIRTAGILIHSRLKVLAVNLSPPSGRLWLLCWLNWV